LQTLVAGEVICDAFCGIGPFALRAAKERNCKVYASDLNPYCFEYLQENIKLNKLNNKVTASCGDAREFIYQTLKKSYENTIPKMDHFYMNLPGDAMEFLDVFPKFFAENKLDFTNGEQFKESLVHVYCFMLNADEDGRFEQVFERARLVMPLLDLSDIKNVHKLKTVSSEKEMLCVTLKLSMKNCGLGDDLSIEAQGHEEVSNSQLIEDSTDKKLKIN
jgi:tRNA (guanine37-N1)-methyltransferase